MPMIRCTIFFFLIGNPLIALSQKTPTAIAKQKLRAERVADRFVQRFRQTLDFGTVWKAFRVSDPSCTHRANGMLTQSAYEQLKLSGPTVEKLYVAVMNYYYLQAVHELSLERIDSQSDSRSEERRVGKECRCW